jgi:hypothetical protein
MTLIQDNIPASRTILVKARSDGEFGVVGRIYMLPGETSSWALEFKGTQLPPGQNLYAMSEPDVTGAESDELTVDAYAVDDTQAKATLALDAAATSASDISTSWSVQLSSTETMLITVPVTVGS